MPPEPSVPRSPVSVDTVRKILGLERQRGFDDRAVVGGIGAFVERVAHDLGLGPDLREMVGAYPRQTPEQRAQTVASIERHLGGVAAPVPADRPGRQLDSRAPATPTLPRKEGESPPKPPFTSMGEPARTRATKLPSTSTVEGKGGVGTPGLPDTPVAALPGVGPARAKRFAAMGILTTADLRLHLPHRYVPYPPPAPAAQLGFQHLASFEGQVRRVDVAQLPGRKVRITAVLGDETGTVAAVWIRAGTAPTMIRAGVRLAVSGPLVTYGRQVHFENPEYEAAEQPPLNTRRITPVYPLTAGLSQPLVRSVVRRALEHLPPLPETLPERLLQEEALVGRDESLRELHAPTSEEGLERARRRFAFDELLPIQLLVLRRRLAYQSAPATPVEAPWPLLAEFRRQLPFSLTGGQQRALSAILDDVGRTRPMIRLLQGEVGSGKTVVAAMVLLAGIAAGGQGAIMAPTEILADQHFRTLTELYDRAQPAIEEALGRPIRIASLTGALSQAERRRTLQAIAAGEVDLVIGTHAVIQSDVEFARLLVAIVDEQHRFGVGQRVAARRKGTNPHLLVMTATPIPRTLALTLYGDLDVCRIDELPAGRRPVETNLLRPGRRSVAYQRTLQEAAVGRQGFVICPLVEGSEAVEARAATTEYERLQQGELAGLRLALLHGRMRPTEKDRTMRAFAEGHYDVLVSTSVVEVGVDVPNATVMVIEGAERFGLAQLHQFRGRVGRGSNPGVCYLIAGTDAPDSLERLEAVARSTDGLELAEADLRIRGPGETFGLRQSGLPSLQIADVADLDFVQQVREAAGRILDRDPDLRDPEHAALAAQMRGLGEQGGEAN